jgi:hypothetical protein
VLFGVVVDVGEGAAFFGVDVVFFSIVEDGEEFFFSDTVLGKLTVFAVDGFFGEDLLDTFDGLGFEIVLDFGVDEGDAFAGADGKFGKVWNEAELAARFDREKFGDELEDDDEDYQMLKHAEGALCLNE